MALRGFLAMLACAAFAVMACEGRPVPLSGQAGATFVIPLAGYDPATVIGYGGLAHEDHQRGELIYRLDGPTGMQLVTRGTTTVSSAPHADPVNGMQVFSLVDVPDDAPLGTHTLHVTRRYTDPLTGSTVEAEIPDYHGEITILPHQIDMTLPDGSMQTVFGEPTPFDQWSCDSNGCSFKDSSFLVFAAVPKPEIRVAFDQSVWAAELSMTYPADVINLSLAAEIPFRGVHRAATVWLDDDHAGQAYVSAVGEKKAFSSLSIAFTLDDGTVAILDPADVTVNVLGTWDETGAPVVATVGPPAIF